MKFACDAFHRPPQDRFSYTAFADPSGGTGSDSVTAAVAHAEDNVAVLDAVYERRAPFNPTAVVTEVKDLLRSYRLTDVTGDLKATHREAELHRSLAKSEPDATRLNLAIIAAKRQISGAAEHLATAARKTLQGRVRAAGKQLEIEAAAIDDALGRLAAAIKADDCSDEIFGSHTLGAFFRYAHDPGVTRGLLEADELFPPEVGLSFKS